MNADTTLPLMTCPHCHNTGCIPLAVHYAGLGDCPVTYCRNCDIGRQLLRDWANLPEQRAYARRLREDRVRRALEIAGIEAHLIDQRLADLIRMPELCRLCTNYVREWPSTRRKGSGFYFWGGAGSGKTRAAAAIVNELVDRDLAATLFLNVPEVLGRIRQAHGDRNPAASPALLDRMKRIELLVLDDLGVEMPSAWVIDLLYQVVDERWRERRPMIVTSTLSVPELARRCQPQVASRIIGCCRVIEVSGTDRRKAA